MSRAYRDWVEHIARGTDKLEVAKPGDGERCDVLVCRLAPQGAPLLLPDNLVTSCSKCFRMVQFRPHAPKRPRRICDECIHAEIAAHREADVDNDITFMITEHTAADVAAYFKKKGLS